jgi:hypothetical protein
MNGFEETQAYRELVTEEYRGEVEPTKEDHFGAPGLSNSGMSDLAVSPLRFWFLHVNPDRKPKEETPAMIFGSALHMAVLEPERFPERYCCEVNATDYPGCLVTMEDLRGWLRDQGITPKGTRKTDVIAQVLAQKGPPIYDLLKSAYEAENAGKTVLSKDFWYRVGNAAIALRQEPKLAELLSEGQAEVPLTARDPETGVLLKGKLDWLSLACTVDIKTFSQMRGKSIDKTIADAIWYDRLFRQAYFYCYLRSLQPGFVKPGIAAKAPPFILAFVEQDEPHEVRLRELRPKDCGEVNLYWERARIEVREHIQTYADYSVRFGVQPWRDACEITALMDQEMPGLAY